MFFEVSAPSDYAGKASLREPAEVRRLRKLLNRWPVGCGKGPLTRLARAWLEGRAFLFEVEPEVVIPGDLDDYVTWWAFVNGWDRQPEVQLSRSLIAPGDTVVDVGAHVGLWVMGAARRAGRVGRTFAFEPVPDTFEKLKANLVLNRLDFVDCRRLAVSDRAGAGIVYAASGGNSGRASLARSVGVDQARETEVTTLDRFCREQSIPRVDFLKVDVEGGELAVFRGASGLLASTDAPAILFEVGSAMAARFGSTCSGVKGLLREYGYGVFRYRNNKLRPVPEEEEHRQVDLFALKPVHFDRRPRLGALR